MDDSSGSPCSTVTDTARTISDAELLPINLSESEMMAAALRLLPEDRPPFGIPQWLRRHSWWLLPLLAGSCYFSIAMVGWRIESGTPIILTSAFLSALATVAIMRMGPRIAVAFGAAALLAGLLVHPAPAEPRNFSLLLCLAALCALHPLAGGAIANHYLAAKEALSTRRALAGLLLTGPALSLAAATFAGCVVMAFTSLSAAQMLAALGQWWVVTAILIPLTVAVVVALPGDARRNVMLSIEQMLPALVTAGFLIALLVGVRYMQTRDQLARLFTDLHEAATEDIAELTDDARWVGGLESLLAAQQYRFNVPAVSQYVSSVSGSVPGLLAISWVPWKQSIPASVSAAATTAMRAAVRTGTVRLVDEGEQAADQAQATYTTYRASYPLHLNIATMTPEQRDEAAIGVIAATYDLRQLFTHMHKLVAESGGQISVFSPQGRFVLALGSPLQGSRMSDDIEVGTSIALKTGAWTAKFRQRAELASIADIRPSDIALSAISLLLGIGMAYTTLDTLRRRRDIEIEVRRRTINLGRYITIHKRAEAELRSTKEVLEIRIAARTAELDASRKQIRAAMDHSPIGLAMVDLEGGWFDVNDSICRILGYSRDELVKLDVYRISHPDDLQMTLKAIRTLLAGESDACSQEKRYLRKDGQMVWVQLDVAVVRDDSGEPVHLVAQIQDISDKRRRTEDLRKAASELESLNEALARERASLAQRVAERTAELRQANEVLKLANEKATLASRAKTEFVAVMSHEIRTPLNGVIGALDMLQATPIKGEQRELVSMGFEAARSLLTIVDDILDFSRIESGVTELDASEFAFEDRLEVVVESVLPMARRLDAELTFWVDPALPHLVLGDEMRVQQIVRNLLANALKFSSGLSSRSKVDVRATLVSSDDPGEAQVQISVQDNGIGMNAEAITRLFQPFTQADQSTTRRFGGSGLGLSICARLAHLMGGRIDVTSQPDAGAIFTLEIPMKVTSWTPESARLLGLSIHVMGGDRGFIAGLESTLSAQSARIADDANGPDSVTIVDMTSVEGDPLEAFVEGSGDKGGVLLLTRNGPRRGEGVGPRMVILDRQVLGSRNLVDAVLMAAGRASCNAAPGNPAPPGDAGVRPLILLVEDNPMNQAVVQRQLEMLGYQVALAPHGEAGLALWRQLRPAIILTDLHMPVMDGHGMVKRILSTTGETIPPIIALTADANLEERNKCLAAGMSGYITKPVRAQVLKSVLDKWILSGPIRTVVPGKQPSQTTLQMEMLEEVAAGDPALMRSLLETFIRIARDTITDLRQALVDSDWKRLSEHAHKFKSSARTIGAMRLGELCEVLERGRFRSDMRGAHLATEEVLAELDKVLVEVKHRLGLPLAATG